MCRVNLQAMQQMVYFNKVTLTSCKIVVQFSIDNYINTSGATSGAGTAYPSRAHEVIPGFQWGLCYSIFSFMCLFCSWLFVLFFFGHCVICPFPIYDSDYPFGIFKLFLYITTC